MGDVAGAGHDAARQAGLVRVREWFAPAFAPEEVLVAALAATPFRLTMINSLIATAKLLVGRNQNRVLLLTDRSIYVVSRTFSRRRFKRLLSSYPIGSVEVTRELSRRAAGIALPSGVPIRLDTGIAVCISGKRYYLNAPGFQLGGGIGTDEDVELFLGAGRSQAV